MTVCFTGHRPQSFVFGFNEQHPDCIQIKQDLQEEIQRLIGAGTNHFLCGMAQGVDTWAAEIVLYFKQIYPNIHLTAVIPCPDQPKKWSLKSVERYHKILAACDHQIMISPFYYRGCMHARNKYMVDHADIVLAIYNNAGSGGTASTILYAKKQNKTVIELLV